MFVVLAFALQAPLPRTPVRYATKLGASPRGVAAQPKLPPPDVSVTGPAVALAGAAAVGFLVSVRNRAREVETPVAEAPVTEAPVAEAPVEVAAPAPAPPPEPAPAPAPKKASQKASKKAPAPDPAPAPAPKEATAPAPAPKEATAPAPAPKEATAPAPAPKKAPAVKAPYFPVQKAKKTPVQLAPAPISLQRVETNTTTEVVEEDDPPAKNRTVFKIAGAALAIAVAAALGTRSIF